MHTWLHTTYYTYIIQIIIYTLYTEQTILFQRIESNSFSVAKEESSIIMIQLILNTSFKLGNFP